MGLKGRNSPLGSKFPQFVDKVKDSIDEIQKAIKILALGIDYRRFAKFNYLTPMVSRSLDGTYRSAKIVNPDSYEPQISDAEFCYDFIIEISIVLQEFDYRLPRNA